MHLKNTRIGVRLALGFAVMVILLIATGVMGLTRMAELDRRMQDVTQGAYPKTVLANDVILQENIILRSVRNLLLMSDAAQIQQPKAIIATTMAKLDSNLQALDKSIDSAGGRSIFNQIQQARRAYLASGEKLAQLIKDGSRDAAIAAMYVPAEQKLRADYLDQVGALVKFQDQLMLEAATTVHTQYQNARNLTLGLMLVAIAFAVAVA